MYESRHSHRQQCACLKLHVASFLVAAVGLEVIKVFEFVLLENPVDSILKS
jgi:hypothetical protein